MKYRDLDLAELLDIKLGQIRFAGRRALIMDAQALGILRKELVKMFGEQIAKGLLLRMGYYHGWLTAENLKKDFPWDSDEEWRKAGGRLHELQGHVEVEIPEWDGDQNEARFAWAVWRNSYEADQHIVHLGRAEEPVCWALTGFASGYMSRANGREVIAREMRCRGKGDAVCYVVAKYKEDWGDEGEALAEPYQSPCLESALETATRELKRLENKLKRKQVLPKEEETDFGDDIVARSKGMCRVLELGKRVSRVDSVVLITGESGVGKERIANLIHGESARLRGPFVAVNCGAVTESLLESELFGHARGAFTGASQDRPGLFEAANGGTLFLDEIGELPASMQVKLLRVLQERQVRRVGENRNRPINVRLIAATNRELIEEVEAGNFRKDLYYRLKVIQIRIPPLRDRREDILPLARYFLADMAPRLGRPELTGFHPRTADQLQRYSWPGNVRELQNAVEHAVVLALEDRVLPEDLPEEVRAAKEPVFSMDEVKTLADVERAYILATLQANEGNQTQTAKQLAIGTATLYRKLKAYGVN